MLYFIRPIYDDFSWNVLGYYATLDSNLPNALYLPWWNHIFVADDKMETLFEDFELVLCSF